MHKGGLHAPVMSEGDTSDPEEAHTRLRELVEVLGESPGPASHGPEEGGHTLLLLSASAANGALAPLLNKLLRFGDGQRHMSLANFLCLPHTMQVEVLVSYRRLGPDWQEKANKAYSTVKPEAGVASIW